MKKSEQAWVERMQMCVGRVGVGDFWQKASCKSETEGLDGSETWFNTCSEALIKRQVVELEVAKIMFRFLLGKNWTELQKSPSEANKQS